jgi:polyisoprenyl-teichoic acid--peptidoglycan teichoic acid transferase
MSAPGHPIDDERPPGLWRGMWARFAIAAVVIVALSGGATAVLASNKLKGIAKEIFPPKNRIHVGPHVIEESGYEGKPQTFLVLGSDRRSKSKNSFERDAEARSDTILLVRFDPGQGQTSVLSIPRDLMVNIRTPDGQLYTNEKINAAYTIGSRLKGVDGGSSLAAETIEREVFPKLKLQGVIDVNFAGFINVVDTLGCAYVNVDHRYFGGGVLDEDFSAINLQPGYQKLCYNNALSYVRFRHFDSDFVRVARQQDFLRDLREQVNPQISQIDRIARSVGDAIHSTFDDSNHKLIELGKLIAFSQRKPLRQVRFLTSDVDAQFGSGSYVTSTPELEKKTLENFLRGHEKVNLPATPSHARSSSHHHHGASPASLGLIATGGESEAVDASLHLSFRVLYPSLQTGLAEQQTVRPYELRNVKGQLRHAYVVVWQQNLDGGYYDFEGTDWTNPPLFKNARTEQLGSRTYKLVDDGEHIHVIGWSEGRLTYWLTNTLLEELSNAQMLAIAKSAQILH